MAHPNCQQHLTTIWFGPELGFMQSLALWKNMLIWMAAVPLLPVLCIMYIISPESKVSRLHHSHHLNLRKALAEAFISSE